MGQTELKPCPFCGCEYVKDDDDFYWAGDHEDWCPLQKDFPGHIGNLIVPDEQEYIEAWNRREANANHDFLKKVMQIAEEYSADEEEYHGRTDDAMEELLIELGYGDAVAVIRSHGRWYS